MVADCARGHGVHPIEVDECCRTRIQLHVVAPELPMAAHLTPKWTPVNLDGRDFLVAEDTFLTTE
jgi:hypothetical protein